VNTPSSEVAKPSAGSSASGAVVCESSTNTLEFDGLSPTKEVDVEVVIGMLLVVVVDEVVEVVTLVVCVVDKDVILEEVVGLVVDRVRNTAAIMTTITIMTTAIPTLLVLLIAERFLSVCIFYATPILA
jgi:hypothetical protein